MSISNLNWIIMPCLALAVPEENIIYKDKLAGEETLFQELDGSSKVNEVVYSFTYIRIYCSYVYKWVKFFAL